MADEIAAARRALIQERLSAAANRIAPAVRPIMGESARKRPEVVGSGVLVRIAERRFLFTAAHVLDALENRSSYLDLAGTLVPLAGHSRSTKPPSEGRHADRLDFAYVLLAEEARAAIPDSYYLSADQLGRDEQPRYESPGRTPYLVAGYPSSRLKVNARDGTYHARPMPLATVVATLDVHRQLQLSTDSHIALEFDRSRMVRRAGPAVGPEPRGVSGGGVFRLDSLTRGLDAPDKLVGIVVSWRREPPLCLIATRIEAFLAPISVEFPETWPHIRGMGAGTG